MTQPAPRSVARRLAAQQQEEPDGITHATLLRSAMDHAKARGLRVRDIADELDISPVHLYEMLHANFVPVWHWPNIERVTDRAVRQEDFLRAGYRKPTVTTAKRR